MIRFVVIILLLSARPSVADINPLTMTPVPSAVQEEVKAKVTETLTEDQKDKLKSPQVTMRTFMTSMDKIKKGVSTSFEDVLLTIDLSEIAPQLRQLTGKITAERLINTIDRIAKINFSQIPAYADGPKWYFRKQTVSVGDKTYDVEIALAKTANGAWKFTPETVSSIENFYSSLAQLKVVEGVTEYRNWRTQIKDSMPAWTAEEVFTLKKGQWLGLLALFFISLGALVVVRFLTTTYLSYKVRQKSLDFELAEQFKSTRPFGLLALSVTWLIGIRFLEFDLGVLEFFSRASYIMNALFMVWSALKIVDYVSLHFEKMAENTANKFDDVLVPMLKKTSKVLVVAFGAILVAHSLTFDVASILAGLGIGGVAVALAAKDTISNLFGSVTVLMDRPFQIGDYISLDKNLEGTVEQVGFRSTRLRTPYNSLVTVPNSVLANMAIDNYGMRRVRRYKTTVQLKYSTPLEQIEQFCERVRYLIQLNPLIQKDNAIVSLFEMNTSSIDIMITVFIVTEEYKIELSERHKFISDILRLAGEMKVEFAYPTHTVLLENNHVEMVEKL
ncbi:MAG: mechanosensitive ion channel family protein [Bacteriovorax sp.]|jgi:MscS family membrane protein